MEKLFYKQNKLVAWCLVTIFIVMFSLPGYSLDIKSECDDLSVKTIYVPFRGSKSLPHKYKLERKATAGFPTVIVLPGGPGGRSIGGTLMSVLIPDSFGLIDIDPRGSGCNNNSLLEAGDLSTEVFAQDVLSVIAAEKIPAREIILWGTSYGTVLATKVGDLNSRQGHEPFKKIVLESIIGFGSNNQSVYYSPYIALLDNYFAKRPGLGKKVEDAIKLHKIDRKVFAAVLTGCLFVGNAGRTDNYCLDDPLGDLTDGLNFEAFEQIYIKGKNPSESANDFVWKAVACNEIIPRNYEYIFVDGKLRVGKAIPGGNHICDTHWLKRRYDARKMQLREDLVYIQGSDDPQTPLSQALYHFKSQKRARSKEFIGLEGFGHSPLSWLERENPGLVEEIWAHDFDPKYISTTFSRSRFTFKIENRKP